MYIHYEERCQQIKARIKSVLHREYDSLRHCIISICVKQYLGDEITQKEIDTLIEEVLINRSLAWEEQNDFGLLKYMSVTGHFPAMPTIFVAFHLASYRMGLVYLLTQGKPITLIASKEVIKTQYFEMNMVHEKATGQPITIIDANEADSLSFMRKHLKEGRSLFVYIDGNTGVDGMTTSNKNLFEIEFLRSSILVRKGIPVISYLCGTGLTPVFCRRDSDTHYPDVIIGDTILPMREEKRDDYICRALGSLYSSLEKYILSDPGSWEGWLYMYKFMPKKRVDILSKQDVMIRCKKNEELRFNEKIYATYFNSSSSLLINSISLQAYELPHIDIGALRRAEYIQTLDKEDIEELVSRQILI